MYRSQRRWIELFGAVMDYEGDDAYRDVLASWPDRNPEERAWLSEMARVNPDDPTGPDDEDVCRLYAASRVTSVLMLRFQDGRADGSDYRGPTVTVDGFRRFHEALGFHVPDAVPFHPFFHEIVGVEQSASAQQPIGVEREAWPALMLGAMMYCRAGCFVMGGERHVVKEVAERSTLYWAYRRKNRRAEDASLGWGSNSQWRTQFRRDYRTRMGFRFNVDREESLNDTSGAIEGVDVTTWVELVRHRCLIRTIPDALDLDPHYYSYDETA